ncbi:hypothetical protein PYW08_008625 [Mythimna loreyi]|uniref:Uncharacterized protein n=1 Tax=Mythimna loreyi TaxID=667449 RepID=A0ACC2QDY6_9NEOP|nr:hypothetical protein PYW08_008625 [Mythimna loreyi]
MWQIDTLPPLDSCSKALACIHSRRRRCGFNQATGELRRFLDRCDLIEFNCEYNTKFKKIKKSYCNQIPEI